MRRNQRAALLVMLQNTAMEDERCSNCEGSLLLSRKPTTGSVHMLAIMQLISVGGIFAHQVKLITYLGTAPMTSGANVAAFGGRES